MTIPSTITEVPWRESASGRMYMNDPAEPKRTEAFMNRIERNKRLDTHSCEFCI